MNAIEALHQTGSGASDFARGYLDYLSRILAKLDATAIGAFAELLLEARERGSRIYFIGNGGSASTASHFANDLSIGSRSWEKPYHVISLTDNNAILTAIGNDFGFEEIFVLQLKTQLKPKDVVVAISVSGNSPNILKAIDFANSIGAQTVGVTGFDGGRLKEIAQMNVHAPTVRGEYGPAEDVHMILNHLVGAFLTNAR